MPVFLRERARNLTERMDDPACDPATLARTFAQFSTINDLVSGWRGLYVRWMRPRLRAGATTVLDLGCGGGDVVRLLSGLAARDGFSPQFLGVDPDPRAIDAARLNATPQNVRFEATDSQSLVARGERFDLVLSNHVLHHLDETSLLSFLNDCERIATRAVLHNDICRSDTAFALFPLIAAPFLGSFILPDGLRSIRRSFTPAELRRIVPDGWVVETAMPFRLILSRRQAQDPSVNMPPSSP